MIRILVLNLALLFFVQSAFANSTKPFFDLVEILRNSQGQVYEIKIRPDLPSKPVEVVQEEMLTSLVEQQKHLGIMSNPIPLSNKRLPGERDFNEFRKIVQKIIKKLQNMNLEDIFKNASLKKFLEDFEERLLQSTRDFQVIARPNNPNYFHSNKVMKELMKRGFKEAKENLPGTLAGIASYIISETVRMLIDRRTYYQNFVAHFLLNHSSEELGLTDLEIARVKSSIHESKVAWDKPWDSWDIEDQWDTYGTEKFDSMAQKSLENWDRERTKFDTAGEFYNLSFVPVIEGGVLKVKNTVNSKNKYSKRLSTAFNYEKPCQQIGFRFVVRLIEMGIYQVPIIDVVKKPLRKYISSLYADQSVQEGFLTGYMLSNSMPEVKYILLQGFNPLIIRDLQWDSEGNNRYGRLTCW